MSSLSRRPSEPRARILAVDDEPFNLDLLRRALGRENELTTCDRPEDALQQLRRGDYDLLVTDVSMPGMDGLSLARAAREARPGMTVLVLSAYTNAQDVIRAHDEGHVDIVVDKPWHPSHLKGQIRRALLLAEMRQAKTP